MNQAKGSPSGKALVGEHNKKKNGQQAKAGAESIKQIPKQDFQVYYDT